MRVRLRTGIPVYIFPPFLDAMLQAICPSLPASTVQTFTTLSHRLSALSVQVDNQYAPCFPCVCESPMYNILYMLQHFLNKTRKSSWEFCLGFLTPGVKKYCDKVIAASICHVAYKWTPEGSGWRCSFFFSATARAPVTTRATLLPSI